jgi:hypothetical protein
MDLEAVLACKREKREEREGLKGRLEKDELPKP